MASGLATGACASNIAQNSDSGRDHRHKGAKKIELEDGEARVKDIVTYPGGDRVDWKVVELPEGQKGELRVKLRFKPARPGMDVAFTVFDQWFHRVGRAKPRKSGSKRRKRVKVENASGRYYIQIYAPRRSDAARYTVSLDFREFKEPDGPTLAASLDEIDDPPELPSIPEAGAADAGGSGGAGGAGGGGASPPAPEPQPQAADGQTDQPAIGPLVAKVTKLQAAGGGGVIVTLNKGKTNGVDRGWQGSVLVGSTENPLAGGNFKIIKVTKRESTAKIKLTIDQVKANRRVLLTPP